ncbi:acyltransferase family protein [Pontibacter ruber]|uniref:hypothetical protein n=1 Tax=Pontibacter ruber TaxID=1343895 RepID=UPI0020287D9E|nr:hypothetical protein [Pontibacter ruber]
MIKQGLKNDILIKTLAAVGIIFGYALNLYLERPLPWNINVVPYTFGYFAIGYYSKGVLYKFERKRILSTVLLAVICAVLIYLGIFTSFYFEVDLKYGVVSNLLLGIVVPILFTLFILMLSAYVKNGTVKRLLTHIGQNTLPIMYLHIVANFIFRKTTEEATNLYLFLLIGLAVPLLLALLFKKYELTNMLFLGNNSKALWSYGRRKHIR